MKYTSLSFSTPLSIQLCCTSYVTTDQLGNFSLPAGPLLIRFRFLDAGPRFDYFTLTLTQTLPVTLSTFQASKQDKTVHLNWASEFEESLDHYGVERSLDGGQTFTSIGSVTALNNSVGAEYRYVDNDLPTTTDQAYLYYRLRANDFDGTTTLHGPVAVRRTGASDSGLTVIPNPATGSSSVRILGADAGAKLSIMSIDGKNLSVLNPSAVGVYELPDLVPGIYLVRMTKGSDTGTLTRVVIR